MRKTSLKDYLFKGRKQIVVDNYFKMLNGYSPVFTTYRGSLYEMDLTRAAVHRFATMCSKLKPEISGAAKTYLEKTLQFKPNFFMDTTKFLYRLATIHEVDNTAFIVPVEDVNGQVVNKILGAVSVIANFKRSYFVGFQQHYKPVVYVPVVYVIFAR